MKHFWDQLPEDKRDKVGYIMHTQPQDENGTDLPALIRELAPDCNIVFSGGVALNIKASKKIAELDEVDNMFVCMAGGDESISIGAAQYLWNKLDNNPSALKPITKPYLSPGFNSSDIDEALKQFKDVLESGFINEGEKVLQFQSKLADYFGTSQVVLTNSCTSSLTMALHAAGVTRGDEVITTAMTCVATNMPIMQLGAQPVWADINFNTGNIDPGEVEKLINDKTT